MDAPSYKRGSTGPVIKRLQKQLKIVKPDGIFGRFTQEAIKKKQHEFRHPVTGEADERFFRGLNLQWPDEFLRCMNLTSALEGTSFGDVNSKDIDGFGITLGIIGFTSANGQVQKLFKALYAQKPDFLSLIPDNARRAAFRALVELPAADSRPSLWAKFAYGASGFIREDFAEMVNDLAEEPIWQQLQLKEAYRICWTPASGKAKVLGVDSMVGRGLLFDIYVQNGGWRQCHQDFMQMQSQDGTEVTRLRSIARAAGHCASKTWARDVMARKLMFVDGGGMVHGRFIDLDAFAFE